MTTGPELPSLMDDVEFVRELEKLEGEPPRTAADRASRVALAAGFSTTRQRQASPSTRPSPERRQTAAAVAAATVIPRDVNRWHVHAQPTGAAPESFAEAPASVIPVVLTVLIGLGAGAAGSALVFHERVLEIVALFLRR